MPGSSLLWLLKLPNTVAPFQNKTWKQCCAVQQEKVAFPVNQVNVCDATYPGGASLLGSQGRGQWEPEKKEKKMVATGGQSQTVVGSLGNMVTTVPP